MEGMDVDLDPELMQKFSCLGTTDKDVLIGEFQRLLGFQLNPAGCAFFLDMTNWNLQAAIGAYYDFESPNINVPSMSFVEDITIGEGESIPPDTQFIKTWRIQNTDVIWVILSVEIGGLLGVTQQLSSFETEFSTQPHRIVEGNFNPFASPQKSKQPEDSPLKDPGGAALGTLGKNTWSPAPDQIEQDQNELSQNSVNLSPNNHPSNLSVVTCSKLFGGARGAAIPCRMFPRVLRWRMHGPFFLWLLQIQYKTGLHWGADAPSVGHPYEEFPRPISLWTVLNKNKKRVFVHEDKAGPRTLGGRGM
ncbi:protein ILRUN isoform X2 [Pleurodeles waltl]|uniref:protein ILRUN isoform X2 n=1 Tax=Pleurodeles waltl TaxID=8319 RepID=UPI0037097332